jgi:hypothetical protein
MSGRRLTVKLDQRATLVYVATMRLARPRHPCARVALAASILAPALLVVAPIQSAPATPASPPPHAMKIDLDARAIAKARGVTVRWHDLWRGNLPQGWGIDAQLKPGLINRTGPGLLHCQGHVADFSSLTFRGGWNTRFDRVVQPTAAWTLTSAAIVLATPVQAQRYFDFVSKWQPRYCLKSGATVGNERVISVQRIQAPAVADEQAAFRFRYVISGQPSKIYGGSLLYLRRGTVNITVAFAWDGTPVPTNLANTLAKTIAARTG